MTSKCDNNGCIGGRAYRTDESVEIDPTKEFCSFECADEYVEKTKREFISFFEALEKSKILNKEFLEVVECSYDTWVSYDDTTRSQAILDQLRPEKGGFISHEEFEEKMKSGEYLRPRKRARET